MNKYQDCLDYIDKYWDKVIRTSVKDDFVNRLIKLPRQFIVPNSKRFKFLFYWDSYFMMQGLLKTKRQQLAIDMVENFAYLMNRFKIIPNISSFDFLDRSQPPLLTTMIMDIFAVTQDKKWLNQYIEVAKKEYKTVWLQENANKEDIGNYHHRAEGYLLSRYGDRDAGYPLNSELESGWDLTSRFYNRCNEFLPIDLNCYLYKYETDFNTANNIIKKNEAEWLTLNKKRKEEINKFCWNEKKGFFFDYDYVQKTQSNFYSLAGFIPLWSGLATQDQAAKMVKNLVKFESKCGLFITAKESLSTKINLVSLPTAIKISIQKYLTPKQWDYPFIWRPVEYLVVQGLIKYGYKQKAKEIIEKALTTEAKIFRKYGEFYEKMNGQTGDIAKSFHYPNQGGFGWTNAVFFKYTKLIEEL